VRRRDVLFERLRLRSPRREQVGSWSPAKFEASVEVEEFAGRGAGVLGVAARRSDIRVP
jgi:hypothetical protein